jgi:hypothetical protein
MSACAMKYRFNIRNRECRHIRSSLRYSVHLLCNSCEAQIPTTPILYPTAILVGHGLVAYSNPNLDRKH